MISTRAYVQTSATTHVLCTPADYSKKTNKVILVRSRVCCIPPPALLAYSVDPAPQAEAKGIAVVSEGFLEACESAGKLVDPSAHSLSAVAPQAAAAKPVTTAPQKAIIKEVSWYWAVCHESSPIHCYCRRYVR